MALYYNYQYIFLGVFQFIFLKDSLLYHYYSLLIFVNILKFLSYSETGTTCF